MSQGLASGSRLRRCLSGAGKVRELSGCLCSLVLDVLGDGSCGIEWISAIRAKLGLNGMKEIRHKKRTTGDLIVGSLSICSVHRGQWSVIIMPGASREEQRGSYFDLKHL